MQIIYENDKKLAFERRATAKKMQLKFIISIGFMHTAALKAVKMNPGPDVPWACIFHSCHAVLGN